MGVVLWSEPNRSAEDERTLRHAVPMGGLIALCGARPGPIWHARWNDPPDEDELCPECQTLGA